MQVPETHLQLKHDKKSAGVEYVWWPNDVYSNTNTIIIAFDAKCHFWATYHDSTPAERQQVLQAVKGISAITCKEYVYESV